jgi:hypothetical protein
MTLQVTIKASNGDGSKAIKITHSDGNLEQVVKIGNEVTIALHQSKSLVITEVDVPVEAPAEDTKEEAQVSAVAAAPEESAA